MLDCRGYRAELFIFNNDRGQDWVKNIHDGQPTTFISKLVI